MIHVTAKCEDGWVAKAMYKFDRDALHDASEMLKKHPAADITVEDVYRDTHTGERLKEPVLLVEKGKIVYPMHGEDSTVDELFAFANDGWAADQVLVWADDGLD